jgi:glycosyltransferase involved in cell wall biosynthesis
MNIPFCIWLWSRARRGDIVDIMVHEAFLRFREGSWKQDCAALAHRLMTAILLRAANRVWMSTSAWESMWRPYCFGRQISFIWLPIPSNIPVAGRLDDVSSVRRRYAGLGQVLFGHFGTYGRHVGGILELVLPALLRGKPDRVFLLLGRDGDAFRQDFVLRWPELASQLHAPGNLQAAEVSAHLTACSLLLQPYPDGVTTRRTSIMAGMAHGVPVLTTSGELTEAVWTESDAVALTPAGDWAQFVSEAERLLVSQSDLARLGRRGREFYAERFETSRVISALRGVQGPLAIEARS